MHLPSTNVLIQVAIVGLLTGGVYALMASGLTLIFGVMRVINIAHGAFLIFTAYISYWFFTNFGLDPFLSLFITVPVLFVIGILFQKYVLERVKGDPGLIVLLTFASALVIDGTLGTVFETTGRSIRTEYTSAVLQLPLTADLTLRLPWIRIAGFAAAVVTLVVLNLFLTRTDMGRAIRATTQNKSAAQLVGVNVDWVQSITFGIGLATVAVGGVLFSLIWTWNPGSHTEWISKMLSIIVLGGMGSLPGAFLAALIMGVTEGVAAVTMSSYISPIVFFLVLFLVLVFRPQGLLGKKIREG